MRRSIYTLNPTSPGSSIAVLEPQAMNALSPAASVELLSSTVESGCYVSEIDAPPPPTSSNDLGFRDKVAPQFQNVAWNPPRCFLQAPNENRRLLRVRVTLDQESSSR